MPPKLMENKYDPITLSEAKWWANKAKTVRLQRAEEMQSFLLSRAAEVGVSSPEVMAVINGMLDPFVEDERQIRRELIAEDLRRKGILEMEKIEADDDQIVLALKLTLSRFQSDWDWGGPYRILVDCCDFPPGKADFVRRMARMGVYPKDNYPKNLEHSMPPAIRGTEWHDHQFSYQAIQKGVSPDWPDTYYGWMNSDIQDRDFLDRRSIAKIFKDNLLKAVKSQNPTQVY
jgi:hypothetical protein